MYFHLQSSKLSSGFLPGFCHRLSCEDISELDREGAEINRFDRSGNALVSDRASTGSNLLFMLSVTQIPIILKGGIPQVGKSLQGTNLSQDDSDRNKEYSQGPQLNL